MNAARFKQALERVGFKSPLAGAALFFDYNERTVRRWMDGEADVPHIVAIVLWLMEKFQVKPEDLPVKPSIGWLGAPKRFTSLNDRPRSKPEPEEPEQ
jgi:hypothetical protein